MAGEQQLYAKRGSELSAPRLQLIPPSCHDRRGQAPPGHAPAGIGAQQAQQAPGQAPAALPATWHAPAGTGARTSSYAGDLAVVPPHVPLAPASYAGVQIADTPVGPLYAAWKSRQLALYTTACHKLNTWVLHPEEYLTLFGPMSNRNDGFGDNVFEGMLDIFERYPHRHKMTGTVRCGWFLCPIPFSKANATTPPRIGELICFPAIFTDGWQYGQLTMGCQNLLMDGSKPWFVNEARAINLVVAPDRAWLQLQLR